MKQPKIVDEVRAARDVIAKASGYDIEKIAAAVRNHGTKSGRKYVRLAPRSPASRRKTG